MASWLCKQPHWLEQPYGGDCRAGKGVSCFAESENVTELAPNKAGERKGQVRRFAFHFYLRASSSPSSVCSGFRCSGLCAQVCNQQVEEMKSAQELGFSFRASKRPLLSGLPS